MPAFFKESTARVVRPKLRDGAFGRTLQFFLRLLLFNIGLADRQLLVEAVHLTFDIEQAGSFTGKEWVTIGANVDA